jgi:hypothetical protein
MSESEKLDEIIRLLKRPAVTWTIPGETFYCVFLVIQLVYFLHDVPWYIMFLPTFLGCVLWIKLNALHLILGLLRFKA